MYALCRGQGESGETCSAKGSAGPVPATHRMPPTGRIPVHRRPSAKDAPEAQPRRGGYLGMWLPMVVDLRGLALACLGLFC